MDGSMLGARNASGRAEGFMALAADIIAAEDPQTRFQILSSTLAVHGLDQINYGFFDPIAASQAEAEVIFLSTMRDGWLDFYYDQQLHLTDPHVVRIRAGGVLPYRWGDEAKGRLTDPDVVEAAIQTEEAGLVSEFCVPLVGPFSAGRVVAGITLGSSLKDRDLFGAMGDAAPHLVALAHLFHNLSLGALTRQRAGVARLSQRQRDCLQYAASGLRADRIAHRLGIARVTVDLHLKQARVKLGARSLAEAVAKAMIYGEIDPG